MLELSSHSNICWIHEWSQGKGKNEEGKVMHQCQMHWVWGNCASFQWRWFQSQFPISPFVCLTYSIHTFKNREPSGSFQLIGRHLYLLCFAWGGVDVYSTDVVEVAFTVAVYDTLPSPLKHILLHNFKYDSLFPNPWNNCPIYLRLKIDQDPITSQPNSRTLLDTSLTVQWPARTEM